MTFLTVEGLDGDEEEVEEEVEEEGEEDVGRGAGGGVADKGGVMADEEDASDEGGDGWEVEAGSASCCLLNSMGSAAEEL